MSSFKVVARSRLYAAWTVVFRIWESDNTRALSSYRSVARRVLFPVLDTLRGTHAARCLNEIEESQWWPYERIVEMQSQRLQYLIQYAYERVPYYRRAMDERGISPGAIRGVEDISLLPVLTKSDVREHMDELVASGFAPRELLPGRTSGSTGTPLAFYSSKQGRWSYGLARSLRALGAAGVFPGDRTVCVTGSGGFVRPAPLNRLTRAFSRKTLLDPARFSDETLPEVVEDIRRLRPQALLGYASAICIIAAYIRDSGTRFPQVGAVVTGGEELFPAQRALIRDVFGCGPFSKYSSFENYDIAMECSAHSGLHVAAEDLIVEVVDAEGRPVEPGFTGRVIVTNLREFGMPLIRYDTADESSLVSEVCECGRGLPRLSAVVGRVGEVIYTPSGKRLSTVSLDSSILVSLGVTQFQLVQERIDHVTVSVVPGGSLSPADGEATTVAVRRHFESWLGDSMQVDVVAVQRIAPTDSGKHRYQISRVTPSPWG